MSDPDTDDTLAPTIGERLSMLIGAVTGDPLARADVEMRRVIEELHALGLQPIEDLTPDEARRQPTFADAVRSVMAKHDIPATDHGVAAHDVMYPGADGDLPARIYRPQGRHDPSLPIILYFHGGGFVLADLDVYDATPRAIAARTGAVVVSAHYRRAPEHKFPAAHDDAVEAYRWVLEEAETIGGDAARVAVMGESVGGNLAVNVAIAARDLELPAPVHQALIYPVVGVSMRTPSYKINEFAKPLNKAMVLWFVGHVLPDSHGQQDPRIDVFGKANLAGLPSTTLVTAEIDPLRSEGQALAEKLRQHGVDVNAVDYEGVTHEFFGMTDVLRAARAAQEVVANDLMAAFAKDAKGARRGRAL